MSFYVSMKIPGSELSQAPINDAITALASKFANEKRLRQLPEKPMLDLAFMLPGKNEKPDFIGMRMGGYNNSDKTLYFETAVPEHITRPDSASDYAALVVIDMIDNAADFFTDSGIYFDVSRWRETLQNLNRKPS